LSEKKQVVTSIYLEEKYCDKLRELLEKKVALSNALDNWDDFLQELFDIIDESIEDYCEDYESDRDRVPSAAEEASYYGEDRG